MARKNRHHIEMDFGSDSFLDIVANIVGILIILIVVVGLRVKNQPVVVDQKQNEQQQQLIQQRQQQIEEHQQLLRERAERAQAILAENERRKQEYQQQLALRERELERRRDLKRQAEQAWAQADEQRQKRLKEIHAQEQRQQQIDQEAKQLRDSLEKMRTVAAEAKQQLRKREQQRAELVRGIELATVQLKDLEAKRNLELAVLKEQDAQWQASQQTRQQLEAEIEKAFNIRKPVSKWVHYPTSLSELVNKEQIHFRCKNGRVAYTYLNELLEQARGKVRVQGGAGLVTGRAGPMGGFRLNYRCIREIIQPDFRSEPYINVRIDSAQLEPESDDLGEPILDALEMSSRFQALLLRHPSQQYAITLWVYPDSFAKAKLLSDHLSKRAYTVSLRPLDYEMPIGTSSTGLRSRSY